MPATEWTFEILAGDLTPIFKAARGWCRKEYAATAAVNVLVAMADPEDSMVVAIRRWVP